MDIIDRPLFYFKHNISESEFCLRIQMVPLKCPWSGVMCKLCRLSST
jgi:hypothetical protein